MRVDLYRILDEPTDVAYGLLLDFVRPRAATFSLLLVSSGRESRQAQAVLDQLKSHLIDKTETAEWPGTRLMEGYLGLLHRYSVDAASVEILREKARGLYSWQAPELPDDLCFYRSDGSPVLSSTSHENESELRLDVAEYSTLTRLAPNLQLLRVLEN